MTFAAALLLLAAVDGMPARFRSPAKRLSEAELNIYPSARGMPADVQRLIVLYEDCAHWSGEEPYDADRAAEIDAATRATCPGLTGEKARLLRRHFHDRRIRARLMTLAFE